MIRIDPNEMETACAELRAQADVVGETLNGLRARCTCGSLPLAVADQVDATIATLERTLKEIQVELVLEALILALRGIIAIKASAAIAGQVHPVIPAPAGFVSSGGVTTAVGARTAATGPTGVGAFFPGTTLGIADLKTPSNPWTAPEPNDFKSWSNSMKVDTNNNGIPNGMDKNFRGTGPDNYKPKPSEIYKPKPSERYGSKT
jgi:hypothetical protein